MGGISIPSLLIILAIVILLFGTKRLRNIGSDMGNAVKGFKKAMGDSDDQKQPNDTQSEQKISSQKQASNTEEKQSEQDSSRK